MPGDPVVFVHCANGKGRSACFAAAVLLLKGISRDITEAHALLRKRRGQVRISRTQCSFLERVLPQLKGHGTAFEDASNKVSTNIPTISPRRDSVVPLASDLMPASSDEDLPKHQTPTEPVASCLPPGYTEQADTTPKCDENTPPNSCDRGESLPDLPPASSPIPLGLADVDRTSSPVDVISLPVASEFVLFDPSSS